MTISMPEGFHSDWFRFLSRKEERGLQWYGLVRCIYQSFWWAEAGRGYPGQAIRAISKSFRERVGHRDAPFLVTPSINPIPMRR
jgi:hypothetical protein